MRAGNVLYKAPTFQAFRSLITLINASPHTVLNEVDPRSRRRNDDRPRWTLRNVCHRHTRLDTDAHGPRQDGVKLPMVRLAVGGLGRSSVSCRAFFSFLKVFNIIPLNTCKSLPKQGHLSALISYHCR